MIPSRDLQLLSQGHNPSVFILESERQFDLNGLLLRWHSRCFNVGGQFVLTDRWVADLGTPALAELGTFIQQVVGSTLANFYASGMASDAAMGAARVLVPHFQRAIEHKIEELEIAARNRWSVTSGLHALSLTASVDTERDELRNQFRIKLSPQPSKDAEAKAEKLLLKNLDAEQTNDYRNNKGFTTTAADGKTYRITYARSFNVADIEGTNKWCGQLTDTPLADQMLAQKLLLEQDPDKFFKNANCSRYRTVGAGGAGGSVPSIWWAREHFMSTRLFNT